MKKGLLMILTAVFTLTLTMTVFAGTWKQDAKGWWWDNGDGTWPANQWQWCDGNNDGIAECYYFDGNGYCLMNTTTPDGYQVNKDGAWIVNGVVQTKKTTSNAVNTSASKSGNNTTASAQAHGSKLVRQEDLSKPCTVPGLADFAASMNTGNQKVSTFANVMLVDSYTNDATWSQFAAGSAEMTVERIAPTWDLQAKRLSLLFEKKVMIIIRYIAKDGSILAEGIYG